MQTVPDGSSTATVESSSPATSFADEIGALFGDVGDNQSESPETEATPAGAPPATTEPASSENAPDPAAPDGTGDAAHAGAPPAVAAETAPDPELDPTKDASPLTYVVNGQERTFDGVMRLGEAGGFITAEHLPKLQQRLSERDHYFEKDQLNHQKVTALEHTLQTLTQWNAGKDAEGKERILSGADGLEQQRVILGQSLATLDVFLTALKDRQQFAALVDTQTDPTTGEVSIIPNAQAFAALQTRAELAAVRAEQQTRTHFASIRSQLPQGGRITPTAPAPEAPIADIAMPTVDAVITNIKATGFTPEDRQFFAEQLPRYVRPTTPQEKQQGLGTRIVDESFVKLIQREAQRRTESSKTVANASTVAAENAKRLAQAAVGARRPAPATPNQPATPRVTPQSSRQADADAAWDMAERAARRRTA